MPETRSRSLADAPHENWLELTLFLAIGAAVSLAELLVSHIAEIQGETRTNPITHRTFQVFVRAVPAHHWFNDSLAITIGALVLVCVALLLLRLRNDRPPLIETFEDPRVLVTIGCFWAGTLIAGGIRFYLGHISVTSFATGSAPIVAGILVGVIVAGIDDDGSFPWHRQLALMYLLIGSVATAVGTIPAPSGWFWGACFIFIFGGLGASVCLTVDILLSRSTASAPQAT